MKKIFPLLLVSLFLVTTYVTAQVVITEVMYDTKNTSSSKFTFCLEPDCEWIEIYNTNSDEVDLTGYYISIINENEGPAEDTNKLSGKLGPGKTLIIAADLNDKSSPDYSNGMSFEYIYGDNSGEWGDNQNIENFLAIEGNFEQILKTTNKKHIQQKAQIVLWKKIGQLEDSVTLEFGKGTGGYTYEKLNPEQPNTPSNWRTSTILGGTPGKIGLNQLPNFGISINDGIIPEDYPFNITVALKVTDNESDTIILSLTQTNPGLINCVLENDQLGDKIVKCTPPTKNQFGKSKITITSTDNKQLPGVNTTEDF